jgi:tRNA 2-selenouridine synthase
MPIQTLAAADVLHRLHEFDCIIDARSPGEFALDHLPEAVNWPSLDDAQRVEVGTLYKQVGSFDAKRLGAAYVAQNAARHLLEQAQDKPKQWRPLLYCWRGGNRSGAQATIYSAVGWRVGLIEGGYKAFRAAMVADLPQRVAPLTWQVVAGPTGVGKTHILHALAEQGQQVLDLEALANHRSSVLGLAPGQQQPTQKHFEMRLWQALCHLDPSRPVFVESESKRVGNVTVPEALIQAMRASAVTRIELDLDARVRLLMRDYAHFVEAQGLFMERLDTLVALLGHARISDWKAAIEAGDIERVVRELLLTHYDPRYFESMARNFARYAQAGTWVVRDEHPTAMAEAARALAAAPAPSP